MLGRFDFKNGEDYVCVLCGERKHTGNPRPDRLCDACWELKTRIEGQPELARKVLANIKEEDNEGKTNIERGD